MTDKIKEEYKTIALMIGFYCRKHHKNGGDLCNNCNHLLLYAQNRLKRCPYGKDKPVCSCCTTHCYGSDKRDDVRKVMRWAGPKMIWRHPVAAVRHLIKLKKK